MKRPITAILKSEQLNQALAVAVKAAQTAGQMMRRNLRVAKKVNAASQHDIKLDLDVQCQQIIEKCLRKAFPQHSILGEEGDCGEAHSLYRWVVDPIDGTVNFAYGIPHACVSIALQYRSSNVLPGLAGAPQYQTELGVVYDPFCEEMWTAVRGQPARLNDRLIQVSNRQQLKETIISLGFAKHQDSLEKMLPNFQAMVHRVRKIRIMGSAALDLVYVATGRMDAYLEAGVRLWDIAAGGFILECAGGEFWHQPLPGEHFYRVIATNGTLRSRLEKLVVLTTTKN